MIQDIKIPSISTLHQEKSVKETSKIDIFNIVLNKCVEKIIFTNRNTDKTFIIFEIPKILIGYPNYDMKNCILFIISQLSGRGYLVEFMEPFYLYIDWGSKPNNTMSKIKTNVNVNVSNKDKLRMQTKALLTQFPDTSKIEFVYEDALGKTSKNTSKKNKKNKRK